MIEPPTWRADRRRQHARGDCRGRARGRAAGGARGVERIGCGRRMRAAELGGGGLGEDDGARLAQRPHRRVVALREIAFVGLATELSRHVLCFEQILDADRQAVDGRQRTVCLPALAALIRRRARGGHVGGGEGFDDGLALLDGVEASFEIGARGVAAVAEAQRRVVEGERAECARVVAGGGACVHGDVLVG